MTLSNADLNFAGFRALVIGDVMLDETIWGDVKRISPEAPVPIVEVKSTTQAPGGAANVAANIASLGGTASLIGVVGSDNGATSLRHLLEQSGVEFDGVDSDSSRPTTVKTRIVAHSQQVVRVDAETRSPLSSEQAEATLAVFRSRIGSVGACVLSDYAKGVATPQVCAGVIEEARKANVPVIVDPKGSDFTKYRGAFLLTPNHSELEVAVGRSLTSESELFEAAEALRADLNCNLLVTRGSQGMTLFRPNLPPVHEPTVARTVFDVTGAGDTVVSTLALALATGFDLESAAILANRAAGVAVGKIGTARVTLEELRQSA